MPNFSRLDAFAKPREDVRNRSVLGGSITVVALTTAILLFLSEIYLYMRGIRYHSLHLSESQSIPILPVVVPLESSSLSKEDANAFLYKNMNTIPLKVHVTFPHVSCTQLDFTMNDASLRSGTLDKTHGKQSIKLRAPTSFELSKAGVPASAQASASASAPGSRLGFGEDLTSGCTVMGNLRIQRVGGEFAIAITRRRWMEATTTILMQDMMGIKIHDSLNRPKLNTSHYIHNIQFGIDDSNIDNPLQYQSYTVENKFGGIALQHIQVTLIPTIFNKYFTQEASYQLAVIEHTVQPETLIDKGVPFMPGISCSYDFSPLAVHEMEERDNLFVFVGSLVSIVGGVFVTVGLLIGCFVSSAAAVAKKLD